MNESYYIQDQAPDTLRDPVKLAALKKCDLRSLEEMVRIARLGVADLRTSNASLLLGVVKSDNP